MSNLNRQDREILDNFKGMSVGQIFIKARQAQGLDIAQISTHLNIGSSHLEAIETDDKDALPQKVYAVGFVRAYADVLGLDSEKMAYLFKLQSYGQSNTEQQKHIVRTQGKNVNMQGIIAQKLEDFSDNIGAFIFLGIAAIVAITVISTLVWLVWSDHSDDRSVIPAVPPAIMEQQLPTQPVVDAESSSDAPSQAVREPMDLIVKPEQGGSAYGGEPVEAALVFKATEKAWLEIRPVTGNDGVLLTRTLKSGDVFYTPKDTDVMVTTGNAGGIDLYLDGQNLGKLGEKGEIIRLRPFSAAALRLQIQQ